ncbi:MAG: hypothetical protein P4L16_03045 [Chlamydiales bacterium]|nr:hypothetical protein [Chlamydiales bacterium]
MKIPFSLTQRFITNTALDMQAPLSVNSDNMKLDSHGKRITLSTSDHRYHFIEAEIIARIIAVAISVFALVDAAIHLSLSVGKSLYLIPSEKGEVLNHIQHFAWFITMVAIGSITGVICPGLLEYYQYVPKISNPFSDLNHYTTEAKSIIEALTSDNQKNAQAAIERIKSAFSPLVYGLASKKIQYEIVQGLNAFQDRLYVKQAIEQLSSTIYRPIRSSQRVVWPAEERSSRAIDRAVYFHATKKEEALEGILSSSEVQTTNCGFWFGAYVSTRPESGNYGRFVLGFRRNIEFFNNFNNDIGSCKARQEDSSLHDAYHTGFVGSIPVNEQTLECIFIENPAPGECTDMKRKCSAWAGREIEVLPLTRQMHPSKVIPNSWPGIIQDDNNFDSSSTNTSKPTDTPLSIPKSIAAAFSI